MHELAFAILYECVCVYVGVRARVPMSEQCDPHTIVIQWLFVAQKHGDISACLFNKLHTVGTKRKWQRKIGINLRKK